MSNSWLSPPNFTLECVRRQDGGIRISSPQVPGLALSHSDPEAVFRDLPKAINALTSHNRPVFVFASNLGGRHGAGSAKHAAEFYGAVRGVGSGRTGHAYAIPTKDGKLNVLALSVIKGYVDTFIAHAMANRSVRFQVVAIGTGLAGYRHEDIAPMFIDAPSNCILPTEWVALLGRQPAP